MNTRDIISELHIGMRTFKTALAVLACLVIDLLLGRDSGLLGATAAIICMQDSVEKSLSRGISRLAGTLTGALLGMGLLYIKQAVPGIDLLLLLAPIGVMLMIVFCNIIKQQDSTVIGCIVLLIIITERMPGDPFFYSSNRLLDTSIGIAVAVIINLLVLNPARRNLDGQDGTDVNEERKLNMYSDPKESIDLILNSDQEVGEAIRSELGRQRRNLELIASENLVSPQVMAAAGSVLTNKYAEGYPGKRYYGGCESVDVVEKIAIERAKKIFGSNFANVQPHSGAQANEAAYAALLQPGDTVLGMNLSQGGHLTHGSPVNFSGKLYNFTAYGVDPVTHRIDFDEVRRLALESKPRVIVAGATAYPRIIDFEKFAAIAKECGAYLMVDMAHIAGLVAAGVHPSPVPYADVVTSTTHKTLRGIRGGLILSNDPEIAQKVDKAVFPGTQGGPLMHIIAAKAVGFGEVLRDDFKAYQKQIVENSKALADALLAEGFSLVSGGTDNHLMLVDLSDSELTGKEFERRLDEVHITVNKNTVPGEKRSPFVTSGVRIGTAAVTTRGLMPEDMKAVAACIGKAARDDFEAQADTIREMVAAVLSKYPLYE